MGAGHDGTADLVDMLLHRFGVGKRHDERDAGIAAQNLVTLALSAASAAPGTKVTGTVTLDAPAPTGGEVIQISIDNRAIYKVTFSEPVTGADHGKLWWAT